MVVFQAAFGLTHHLDKSNDALQKLAAGLKIDPKHHDYSDPRYNGFGLGGRSRSAPMRKRLVAVFLLCAAIGSACTSLRPVGVSTDEAQRQIVSGELLKPGDKVRLITNDGKVHDFAITAIDAADGTIKGQKDSVRVAEIVTVEKRELAVGKTLALVLGIVGGLLLGSDPGVSLGPL